MTRSRRRLLLIALIAVVPALVALAGYRVWDTVRVNRLYADAERLTDAGQFADAQAAYERYLEERPGEGRAHFYAGRAARRAGHIAAAREHLKDAVRDDWPADAVAVEQMLIGVQTDTRSADRDKLLEICADPEQADREVVLEVLTPSLLRAGQIDQAAEAVRLWLEVEPGRAEAWSARGQVRAGRGDFDAAAAAFRKAVKLDAKLTPARLGLGAALMQLKDYAAALPHLEATAEAEPATRPLLARCLVEVGDHAAAADVYEQVLASAAGKVTPAMLTEYAGVLREAGRNDRADAVAGRAERMQRDLKRAAELVKEMAEKPDDAALPAEAGRLLLAHGRRARGLDMMRRALQIDPARADARSALEKAAAGQ